MCCTQGSRRRLGRRLQQLHYTWDEQLLHKVKRDVRSLSSTIPPVEGVSLYNLARDIALVQDQIQQLSKLESDTALENWKARMSQDRSQISWIKRKADSYLHFENQAQGGPTPATDLHRHAILPEEVIRQAELEWIPRWTAIQPAVPWEEFVAILEHTPRPSNQANRQATWQSNLECALSPENLWKRCRKMLGKAPGPDAWKADQLVHLPWQWWQRLADLWLQVLRTGNVPDRWREAAVVLLPKDDGGVRP
jgi:hypothetical protein